MRAQLVSTLTEEMLNQMRDGDYFRKLYDDFFFCSKLLGFFCRYKTKLRITFLQSHGDGPERWVRAK